jgi:[acyl-carrier-protein] S-malonyltransferase
VRYSSLVSALAFLFPGQGSQKVGMGSSLLASDPELLEQYLDQAGTASGLPIRRYCLEGPVDALMVTAVAQPALFAVSLALAQAAAAEGLRPDFVAGHSLGEYTAAVACGALAVDDGIELVSLRGRLMSEIQSERPGAMAAVIGLDAARLGELCEQASDGSDVTIANLNSPTQIVVSGSTDAVERLMELAVAAEAQRVVRLQVGAAFHSPLMEPAQARMAEAMASVDWHDPRVPLVANVSAAAVTSGDGVREALIAQIASPVRWVECVQTLVGAGCDGFLELGPGRVLTGLVRQIVPSADVGAADSPEAIAAFAAERPGVARR